LAKTTDLDERIAALEKLVGTAHGHNIEDLVSFFGSVFMQRVSLTLNLELNRASVPTLTIFLIA